MVKEGKAIISILVGVSVFILLNFISYFAMRILLVKTEATNSYIQSFLAPADILPILIFTLTLFVTTGISIIIYLTISSRNRSTGLTSENISDLLKSRDLFLRLYEEGPVPYIMVDADGGILLPNKAALRLFGLPAKELVNKKFLDFIAPEFANEVDKIKEKFIRSVAMNDKELKLIKASGEERWVRLSILSLRNFETKSRSGVVTLVDVTEQKAIDRVKTEFVSLASHQLRTPLAAIKWYSEMTLGGSEKDMSPKHRKYIQKIYKSNEKMILLVNSFLSASRLELGTFNMEQGNIDVKEVTKDIIEELENKIQERNVDVSEIYSENLDIIYSDEKIIRMIIHNLTSNAVKYAKENGYVKIEIGTNGIDLSIVVEDNGMGIPAIQQGEVFKKMFRADNARIQETDGTGLGLYIVKLAVEALGGEITFTSTENEGTIFNVKIPDIKRI